MTSLTAAADTAVGPVPQLLRRRSLRGRRLSRCQWPTDALHRRTRSLFAGADCLSRDLTSSAHEQEDAKTLLKTGGPKPLGMKSASKLLGVLDEVIHEKKMKQEKKMG